MITVDYKINSYAQIGLNLQSSSHYLGPLQTVRLRGLSVVVCSGYTVRLEFRKPWFSSLFYHGSLEDDLRFATTSKGFCEGKMKERIIGLPDPHLTPARRGRDLLGVGGMHNMCTL